METDNNIEYKIAGKSTQTFWDLSEQNCLRVLNVRGHATDRMNQGINVRLIDDAAATALASIEHRDDQFEKRRLYTAWDNIGETAPPLRFIRS